MAHSRTPPFSLEVAVFSARCAATAQSVGAASRIELNATGSYRAGGLTPSMEELKAVCRLPHPPSIPIRVMVRPRAAPAKGHDFIYSDDEVQQMEDTIKLLKGSGLMDPGRGDGFVFGALEVLTCADGVARQGNRLAIDEHVCRTLVQVAHPFSCTFHRAFDYIIATSTNDSYLDAAHQLADLGFQSVLTNGGVHGSCCEEANLVTLANLLRHLRGRIQIVAGGGLRRTNAAEAIAQLSPWRDSVWFHTAAVKTTNGPPTEELDESELRGLFEKLQAPTSSS